MSYDIRLHDAEGVTLPAPERFTDGGTYAVGGTAECDVNVTYNYGGHFAFRSLHQRTGAETVPELRDAVGRLGTKRDADYWAATPGNAGAACARLLSFAEAHPLGIWEVS